MEVVTADEVCGADKVKYTCVVKDETQTNWSKQSTVFSLPFDCEVGRLCSETAKQLGYQEGSFLLVWEKADNVEQQEIELDEHSKQTLLDLGLNEKRNRFLVKDKHEKPPVKVKGTYLLIVSLTVGSAENWAPLGVRRWPSHVMFISVRYVRTVRTLRTRLQAEQVLVLCQTTTAASMAHLTTTTVQQHPEEVRLVSVVNLQGPG